MKAIHPIKLCASIGVVFLAAAIGSAATYSNIATWYTTLEKPFFTPPNWIFGPVWTILYVLLGISLYLLWMTPRSGRRRAAIAAFGIQLALNALWSVVFFGLHSPLIASFIVVFMIIATLIYMKLAWTISRTATYLLVPYISWISFACALTIGVTALN